MATIVKGNQFSGARGRLEYRGQLVGWATGVSWGHDEQTEPVRVIGNVRKVEDTTVAYDATISVSVLNLVGSSLVSMGWSASIGQSPDQHLINILNIAGGEFVIVDTVTSVIQALVNDVKVTGGRYNSSPTSLSMSDVTMVANNVRYFGN